MIGKISLQLKNDNDLYFLDNKQTIGNPTITFFKSVYRKYANFSLENAEIFVNRNTINEDSQTTISQKIPLNKADLLTKVYLSFNLPNIYSGSYNADGDETSNINNIPYEFRWVENIGTNIIDYIKLNIGEEQINKISGKLMQVLSEIQYDDSKKKIYDELVGNVDSLYHPKQTKNNKEKTFIPILTDQGTSYISTYSTNSPTYVDNLDDTDDTQFSITVDNSNKVKTVKIEKNGYNLKNDYRTYLKQGSDINAQVLILESDYPHIKSTTDNQNIIYNRNNDIVITKNSDVIGTNKIGFIPSIKKRKCKIPIPFYFTKNTGSAIPLCCLQKSSVELELKLNSIKDLYTILKLNSVDITNLSGQTTIYGDSGSHTITDPTRKVFRIKPPSDLNISTFLETNKLDLELKLEVQYMYLENDEKRRFVENEQSYLIEEYYENDSMTNVIDSKSQNYYLNYPVKELIIVSQRNDMKHINNWNNYSNWVIEDVPPFSEQYSSSEHMYYSTNVNSNYLSYNKYDINTTDLTKNFDMKFFDKNIIDKITFKYDTVESKSIKDTEFFNLVQPFQYHPRKIKNGIHVYSFSLNPNEFQPSGYLNFSKVDKFNVAIDIAPSGIKKIPSKNNNRLYKYDFMLYTISYNILNIKSGVGNKEFLY
jgi:hypothetical protein